MEKGKLIRSSDLPPVSVVAPDRSGIWNTGPFKQDSPGDAEIRFRAILRRHSRAIVAVLLSCFAAGVLVTLLMPPRYKAKATIEILSVNQDFMNNKDIDPNVNSSAGETYLETQTKLLMSQSVADRVVASVEAKAADGKYEPASGLSLLARWLGGQPAPTANLEPQIRKALGGMKVKTEGTSSLISITVSASSPQLAADIANSVATEHMAALQEARLNTATETGEFLSTQLEGLLKKLRTSENELLTYAKRTGLIYSSRGDQESVASAKLREIQTDLEKAEADRTDKQAQLEAARNSSPEALSRVLDDGSLREASSRLADLQRQRAALITTYTPEHYKVREVQSQIDALEGQVNQGRATIVTRINNDYKTAIRKEALERDEYERQLSLVTDQSSKEVGYNILKREVDANRDLYQSMLQKVKEASVVAAVRASNIRIVDRAKPPFSFDQPNIFLNLAVALFGGCLFSTLMVLLRERADGSIRGAGETSRLLQLPELAIIPSARRDIRTQIVASSTGGRSLSRGFFRQLPEASSGSDVSKDLVTNWLHTGSVVAESFRSAVASIILWGRERALAHRVLVITSPHSNAGKTTSVLNLGLGLVESGRRVLLIDGDLRLPRLGTVFGLEGAPGLTNLLADGLKPIDARKLIHQTGLPGLYILPSGPRQSNVTQMLHLKQLEALIDDIRPEYDFILIDSPPALPLTDARLLAQHADAVILVVRAGVTTVEQTTAVQRSFLQDGAFVFGSILNDWNAKAEDPAFMNSYMKYGVSYGTRSNGNGNVGIKDRTTVFGK